MLRTDGRKWRNWSGSVRCEPNCRSFPVTLEDIQAEVLRAAENGERLRVAGSGHSFTPLCWTDENLMSLEYFSGIESVDLERRRVLVRAGTRLRHLADQLAERGLGLENMGDIDAQTIGGAIATGTHGTGAAFGNLSTAVTALRLVAANGSVREISADSAPGLFDAARLSLGALGVITHVELQCVEAYRLHYRSQKSTLEDTLARLPSYRSAHRNFEFYWFPYTDVTQVKLSDPTDRGPAHFSPMKLGQDWLLENGALWMVSETARRAPFLSERMARFSAWAAPTTDLVRHSHRAYATPRMVRFNEIEYALPVERVPETLHQIDRLIRTLKLRVHFPLQVSFVRSDDIWLSPGYQRESAFVAAHTYAHSPHQDYFDALAEIFDRNQGRPHWAKMHGKAAHELRTLYPRFDDFCAVRKELDPRGVFLNPHLAAVFGVEQL